MKTFSIRAVLIVAAMASMVGLVLAVARHGRHRTASSGESPFETGPRDARSLTSKEVPKIDSGASLSPEERRQRTEEMRARKRAALDSSLAKEARDEGWAPEAERQIAATLSKVKAVQLSSALCASTLCRVEVVADDVGTQHGLGLEIAWLAPFDSNAAYAYEDGPPLLTIVYFSRKGFPLPRPEAVAETN